MLWAPKACRSIEPRITLQRSEGEEDPLPLARAQDRGPRQAGHVPPPQGLRRSSHRA